MIRRKYYIKYQMLGFKADKILAAFL